MSDRFKRRIIQYSLTNSLSMVKQDPPGTDYPGPAEGAEPLGGPGSWQERTARIVAELTLDECINLLGGYDDLAIQPVPRLGIPPVWMSDATSGVRCFGPATIFPSAIALASTWDRDLLREVGRMIAGEARAYGVSILLGPGVNIARVPTCGRNFEYFGEDPLLTGTLAAAYIQGVQERGVVAVVKHLACNNSEYDRHKTDSVVDLRTLHEIYLPAFRTAVIEGGAAAVMTSYNPVNGVYASEHPYLIEEVLRKSWGFNGMVISDWISLYSTVGPLVHGVDIEMPKAAWLTPRCISRALADGDVTEEQIRMHVSRTIGTCMMMGIYDRPAKDTSQTIRGVHARQVSLQAAQEGIVLLRNSKGVLPLNPDQCGSVIIMGRNGMRPATGGGGSSYLPPQESVLGVYESVRDLLGERANVIYLETREGIIDHRDIDEVIRADVVIIVTGYDRTYESETYDRQWELPEHEQLLIHTATVLNPSTVVVVQSGGDMEKASWEHQVTTLLYAGYLGECTGEALAAVIFGEADPSGRLPFSMVRFWEDIAAANFYVDDPGKVSLARVHGGQGNPRRRRITRMVYGEGSMVGYRHLEAQGIAPVFCFGHGLSYTRFKYSALALHVGELIGEPAGSTGRSVDTSYPQGDCQPDDLEIIVDSRRDQTKLMEQMPDLQVRVSFCVKNIGTRPGKDVPQIYVLDPEAPADTPPVQLREFVKVSLLPAQKVRVVATLHAQAFSRFDAGAHRWVCVPGPYEILVGRSSRDIHLRAMVDLSCFGEHTGSV